MRRRRCRSPLSTTAAGVVARASASDGEAGEVWVSSQGTDRLFVLRGLRGRGGIQPVDVPSGTGPHLINFSPDGEYAYVSGMGNGNLVVVRADDRKIVANLHVGAHAHTHQATPSPDGDVLLLTQMASKSLIKVAGNEATETWVRAGQSLTLDKPPICSIVTDDGKRAYVSLLPNGIQQVDVDTMAAVGKEIPTDGFVACGMVKERDGSGIMLTSSGGGGHVYRLDVATGTLESRGRQRRAAPGLNPRRARRCGARPRPAARPTRRRPTRTRAAAPAACSPRPPATTCSPEPGPSCPPR